jgi:hypothetical protein
MRASDYQLMRNEIRDLEGKNRELAETCDQQHQAIQHLYGRLQEANVRLLEERTTVKILVLNAGGSVYTPVSLINEVASRPYAYDAKLSKDEETSAQIITVTKKSDEEIAAIEEGLKAQAEAYQKAQGLQQPPEGDNPIVDSAIVAPDGRPARESAGKLLVVH